MSSTDIEASMERKKPDENYESQSVMNPSVKNERVKIGEDGLNEVIANSQFTRFVEPSA